MNFGIKLFMTLVDGLEKQFKEVIPYVLQVSSVADAFHSLERGFKRQAGSILNTMLQETKRLGGNWNDIQSKIALILGTEAKTAEKITGSIIEDPFVNPFKDLLKNLAQNVSAEVDNLKNPLIQQYIAKNEPIIWNLWEHITRYRGTYTK